MTEKPKTALITGAGRRLGRHLALAFGNRGYRVLIHANDSMDSANDVQKEIESGGGWAAVLQADLSKHDEVLALAKQVNETAGKLDLLINNAGVFPERPFDEVDEELWDFTLDVNAKSVFFLSQQLAGMLTSAKGSIINMASSGAYDVWLKHIPYNISKAANVVVTRALAKQLAPDVRVNAIAPGIIVVPGEESGYSHPSAERFALKRYGTPEDIVKAAIYLAEDASYLTGHILPVDGGAIELS